MSRGPDAATQFERALLAQAARAGCPLTLVESDWTRWASATFNGARHVVTVSAPASSALERWLEELPEAEFALRNHLVADVAVTVQRRCADAVTATVEALTVEER
ncbi:hypothetical protein [Stakelama tenebrarum]|uniref:Uncharacterized protein n=1 Tax=Stakelama tenebrarum TaxID=2711215 RepID=A0A6G6Y858_9SPHN|nr:hypothetical protein [Sphingosinithalassobacter tenebrarum]QIG81099.1 hypothetical protein G5C33_15780 [Sphingosinithalassobacter tenebrarum]